MQTNNTASRNNIRVFGTLTVMTAAAMFTALSIVFGKFIALQITPTLRVGFESLPIAMASIFLGPAVGAASALVADIVGCILKGYSINPLITAGMVCVGFFPGFLYHMIFKKIRAEEKLNWVRIFISVFIAYAIGSMLLKTIGLSLQNGMPMQTIFVRIIKETVLALIDTTVIWLLMQNKGFMKELGRITKK